MSLGGKPGLSPLFKLINRPKSASHYPHNNISESLKCSQDPCLTYCYSTDIYLLFLRTWLKYPVAIIYSSTFGLYEIFSPSTYNDHGPM